MQRIDHCPIVCTVAGGLDDDVSRQSEKVPGREEEILSRVTRRVFPLRRVGKFIARTEHVTVRVDRAWRWYVGRLRRVRIKRQPIGVHLKGSAHYKPRFARMASSRG